MIILSVLKTVGIVILIILAVILVILAAVLFVPVRYTGAVAKNETTGGELSMSFKITWLLHLICAEIRPLEDEKIALRIAGIKLKKNNDGKKGKKSKEDREKEKTLDDMPAELADDLFEETDDNNEEKTEVSAEDSPVKEPGAEIYAEDSPEEEYEAEEPGQKDSIMTRIFKILSVIIEKIASAFEKFRNACIAVKKKAEEIIEKVTDISNTVFKWVSFITDSDNWEGIVFMLKNAGDLIKKLLPKKIEGEIDIGLDDPARTGQAVAALSVLYPVYADDLKVTPYFEEEILQGNVDIAGRLHLIYVVLIAIKILLHKNSMNVIKFVREQI